MSTRRVVVDDTDSGIQYTGAWFQNQGTEDSVGNFGPTFGGTQHGTTSSASLSYSFSGSQITVLGTTNIRNDSGVIDPSWECFIDNVSIGATAPFQYPENNWVLCNKNGLSDGPHVLTVSATVRKAQTFWIDQLQYVPSSSVDLDQKLVFIDSLDPQLQYGSGWGALGDVANMTSQQGSTFTFDFTGVSLMWFGFIPRELPIGSSTATYSIDGQTPINFELKGLSSSNSATIYNQKFFETGQLSAGSHKLSVVYTSTTGQSTPLTLDYLVIQDVSVTSTSSGASSSTGSSSNGGSSSKSGSSSSNSTSSSSGSSSNGGSSSQSGSSSNGGSSSTGGSSSGGGSSSSSGSTSSGGSGIGTTTSGTKSNIGVSVGGVLGGLALAALIIFGIILLRRQRKKNHDRETSNSKILEPYFASGPVSPGTQSSLQPQRAQTGRNYPYTVLAPGSMPTFSQTESQPINTPSTTSSGNTFPTNTDISYVTTQPSARPPYPLSPKVQREAEAAAVARRRVQAPAVPAGNDDSALSGVVMMHEDSGIRLPNSGNPPVVEVPPRYTPG